MGSEYKWGDNPIKDMLVKALLLDANISEDESKLDFFNIFSYIIICYLNNPEDIVHLDFEIIGSDGKYVLIGNNLISALWMNWILPKSPRSVVDKNEYNIGNTKYTFDEKNKVLILNSNNG
jgi:hypothetical protein